MAFVTAEDIANALSSGRTSLAVIPGPDSGGPFGGGRGTRPRQPTGPGGPDKTPGKAPGYTGPIYTGELPPPPKTADEPTDWTSFIDIFGMPPDVIAEVNRIFASTPDVQQATARAMAYIRGTQWYAQTFPGINEARARGIVQDERDYRRRVNDSNTIYRQYLGRDMTTAEFLSDLGEGISLDVVGKRFEGDAYIKANETDIQYLAGGFGTDEEGGTGPLDAGGLKSYGRQQVGLGSYLGAVLQRRLQQAQQRYTKVFEGTLASPALNLGGQGLNAPSLRATQSDRGDIAA